MAKDKWIQEATKGGKEGTLHRQLGYAAGERIPDRVVSKIVDTPIGDTVRVNGESRTVTRLLKSRAVFANNVRK